MQQYEKYKDSGVDWIGEIPESWKVIKLKYIFKILKRIAESEEFDVLSITQRGIKIKDVTSGEGQLAMDYAKYQFCYVNDFAMNHMDLLTGWVDLSNFDGVISPDYRVFDLINKNCDKKFLLILLQLCYVNKVFYAHGQGVSMLGRWRFPTENFKNFYFPIPQIEQQKKIVNFLNYKTAKINQTITIKEKEIELLKERRQILIQKAVTKGLDDTVKLKDSGVDWIGKIPEHWEVRRIKSLTRVKRGASPRPIDNPIYFDDNGEFAWVRIADVSKSEKYLVQTEQKLSKLGSSLSVKINPDQLFLSIAGSVGKPIISKIKCCIHDGFVYFPDLKIKKEWLYNVFILDAPFYNLGKIGTQLNLNTDTVGMIKIPIPSTCEIIDIIHFIENIEGKIAKIILLKQQEIEQLKEYKTVLIDNVVTGKVKIN